VIVTLTLSPDQVEAIASRAAELVAERFRPESSASAWLTPEQASQAWGISRDAVYRRAKRGRIESRYEGRNVLVRRRA
jgi:helix-turn-helix protein